MITDFDDYMIHQAPVPLAQPGTSDRNFYDRYWFNGLDRNAEFMFEVGLGRYPNRYVMDGHLSVVVDGVQHSFHASRRAPLNPMESDVGPLKVEVVKPMRVIRVQVAPNSTEVECDLTFYAKTIPTQEPKNYMQDGVRVIMDTQRFTQHGSWEGFISIKGRRIDVKRETTLGSRDKSWGFRPVGEYEMGAPSKLTTDPAVYWVWSPIHFGDACTYFLTREQPDGHAQEIGAGIVKVFPGVDTIPRVEEAGERMATARHHIDWQSGTRWPKAATIDLVKRDGTEHHIELEPEPQLRFQMMGIGYQHAEWGHAIWHDELEIGYENWKLSEVDPEEYCHIHVHHLVRAKMGERTGVGILETIVFGRHQPSGFQDLFDGAP